MAGGPGGWSPPRSRRCTSGGASASGRAPPTPSGAAVAAQSRRRPATDGFSLHLSQLTGALRDAGHDLRVLALRRPDAATAEQRAPDVRLVEPSVPGVLRSRVRAALRRRPRDVDDTAAALAGPVAAEIASFRPDVVHATAGPMGALGRHLGGVASVMAALDAWHLNVLARAATVPWWMRPAVRAYARRIRRFEATEYARFDRVVAITGADRDAMLGANPSLRVDVIPNGVDAPAFDRDPAAARVPGRIVFTGVMGYAPNVSAATVLVREILPAVRARVPEAHVVLVGRAPSREVLALAGDAVRVTGEVDAVQPWLWSASAFACPMVSGTGMKNKLLEAMAAGAACVATPLALQGVHAEPGREVLVGETPQELASVLAGVLRDDALAESVGAAARRHVVANHSWHAVARMYTAVYERLSEPGGRRS